MLLKKLQVYVAPWRICCISVTIDCIVRAKSTRRGRKWEKIRWQVRDRAVYHNTTKFRTRGGSSFCADAPTHDASMKQYPATLPGIMHRDGGFIGHGMRLCPSYRHQRTERIGSLNGDINKCRRFSAFVEEASSSPLRWCIVAMRRDINSPFASLVNIPAYTRCLRNRGTIDHKILCDFTWESKPREGSTEASIV